MAQKKRIEYIDCIKGLTILWVVVYHFGPENIPEWVTIGYRMPLFFFLSGIFFRAKPFKDFLIRRINTLIIPFICWMLITASYYFLKYDILAPIIGIQHEPFNPSLLDMTKLFNVHNETVHDPLLINPAMWFLISLPCVQIIFWGINFFLKKKILPILLICTLLHICGIILFIKYDINGLFYIGWTLRYTIYYALGAIIGPLLIQYTQTPKHRIGIICFSIPAIILLNRIHIPYDHSALQILILNVGILCFIPIIFAIFQYIPRIKISKGLSFFGKNSLVILATHWTLMDVFRVLIEKGLKQTFDPHIYYCCLFIFICIASFVLIIIVNKYFPILGGKKDLIKLMPKRNAIPEIAK